MSDVTADIAQQWGSEWVENPDGVMDLGDHLIRYKFNVFASLVRDLPAGARVLEIGCGNSAWLRLLKERFPKLRVEGMDISEDAIRISKEHGIPAVAGDIRRAPFEENSFDFVFSFGVIEHFPETELAVWEHIRILKPGGTAWIEIPNRGSLQGLEERFSNWRHGRDPYRVMIVRGKRYRIGELRRMARYAPYPKEVRVQGSGPVVPYYRWLKPFDRLIPGFVRRYVGGNVGIVITKR